MSKRSVLWVILIPILSFSCSAERGDWKKAKSQHSIEAYQDFLAKYTEGIYADQARRKITELYYEQAVSANTTEAYEEFLKRYPRGYLSLSAKSEIEQFFYDQIRSENLISSYENYLKRYPKGQFADEARARIRKKTTGSTDATVVDNQGNSFLVKGLKAYYEAYGTWHPKTPTDLMAEIHIVLYNMKGRVPVEEKKVTEWFNRIRRIDFKKEEDPKNKYTYEKNIYIQKRDGSSISILLFGDPYVVRVKDRNGKTTKEIRSDRIFFSTGNIQEEEIHLRGFKGLLEEPSGGEREYYIRRSDVRSIAFKEL